MLTFQDADGQRMRINPDTSRAAAETLFGVALYIGTIADGLFTGTHAGQVATGEEAERWLFGEDVERVRIFSDEDAAEARRLMGCE